MLRDAAASWSHNTTNRKIMKNIIKSALLLVLGLGVFTACNDDNDDNPVVKSPTTFVLNESPLAATLIDLEKSSTIQLTCSQPDYGFPASTTYTVEVSLNADMSAAAEVATATTAKIDIDASVLASTLTTLQLEAGKTEADFPMTIPAYFRVKAVMSTKEGTPIEGTEILSNVISFQNLSLKFSLPPVTTPETLYIVGQFCGWDWNKSVEMAPVNGATHILWHMVYIDDSGIKFNDAKSWDGNQKGFDNISVSGDLASEIIGTSDGNIASSNPGWYLMIITTSVQGRDVIYDVQFNKPEVWLMGPCIGNTSWTELLDGSKFTIPAEADGDFVSPEFTGVPGEKEGCRAYVKIPGYDWWKSEFMVFNNKIVYRGDGGDQERVINAVGQKLYLNFGTDTGKIE